MGKLTSSIAMASSSLCDIVITRLAISTIKSHPQVPLGPGPSESRSSSKIWVKCRPWEHQGIQTTRGTRGTRDGMPWESERLCKELWPSEKMTVKAIAKSKPWPMNAKVREVKPWKIDWILNSDLQNSYVELPEARFLGESIKLIDQNLAGFDPAEEVKLMALKIHGVWRWEVIDYVNYVI